MEETTQDESGNAPAADVRLSIVALPKPEADQALVAQLESLLAHAKSGCMIGIAYAVQYEQESSVGRASNTGVEWGVCGRRWTCAIVGGLEMLKGSMVKSVLEENG